MKRSFTTVLAAGALCFLFQSAHATLLFSDSFDSYLTGGLGPSDVNPGSSTAWTGGNSGINVVSGSLTYGSLYTDSSGNMLSMANGAAGTVYNTYANQTSGQVYYSFLFDPTVVDSANTYFTALNPGTTVPGGSGDAIDAYYYSNGKVYLRANPNSATAGTGTALTLNTTYFIVEEIDLTAKTASLWINPDSSTFGTLTPPTVTASLSGLSATAVDNVGFKAQSGTGSFYIDDLLIGTSWADVTATGVPEPSLLALAGLGVFGLISSVRCRIRR